MHTSAVDGVLCVTNGILVKMGFDLKTTQISSSNHFLHTSLVSVSFAILLIRSHCRGLTWKDEFSWNNLYRSATTHDIRVTSGCCVWRKKILAIPERKYRKFKIDTIFR